jgi:hypothetical protein
MSLFTWIGAAVGFNLAHFKFISFDFNFSTEYNYIRALLSQDAFRIPLNSFACTLSGALLGLLTHMTWDVSIPSFVVFLTLSIVTSKQCTKLFSSVCVAPTQKPPITKEEEEEKNEIQQQKEGEEEEQKRKDQEFESELLEEKDKKCLDTEIKSSLEREIDRKEQEDKERERERKEQEDREREVIDRESEESEEFQDKIATNKGVICSQRKRRSNH